MRAPESSKIQSRQRDSTLNIDPSKVITEQLLIPKQSVSMSTKSLQKQATAQQLNQPLASFLIEESSFFPSNDPQPIYPFQAAVRGTTHPRSAARTSPGTPLAQQCVVDLRLCCLMADKAAGGGPVTCLMCGCESDSADFSSRRNGAPWPSCSSGCHDDRRLDRIWNSHGQLPEIVSESANTDSQKFLYILLRCDKYRSPTDGATFPPSRHCSSPNPCAVDR